MGCICVSEPVRRFSQRNRLKRERDGPPCCPASPARSPVVPADTDRTETHERKDDMLCFPRGRRVFPRARPAAIRALP